MTQLTIITKQKKRALLHLEITNEMKREEKSILICRVYFFPGMRNQERFGRFR